MTTICPEYMIGATLNGLVRLPDLGIPDPFVSTFDPFSLRSQAGDGLIVGRGFPVAGWQWPTLTFYQANQLAALVPSTDASAKVYMRTRKSDGTFANYYAVLVVPVLTGEDGTPVEQDVAVYTDFKVRFVHLVAA